jgi:hypothetical protein
MHYSRLLVAVPAAAALVFTGLSPASANPDDKGKQRDSAKILDVGDAYGHGNRSDRLSVEVTYECDSKDDKGWLKVTLTQDNRKKAKYEGDARAKCDGDENEKKVTLHRVDKERLGYARNGDAKVEVKLRAGDATDHERDWVRVRHAGNKS